ncbi:MAG TPA: hydantoinase/oxoprolinase family protein [Nevskiaceae bacterium]|nr:hydantoinase/oxoprolinase family protein [Nevskiaceae bacterium]
MNAPAPRPQTAGHLINIDNGGTLTDICVIAADGRVHRTKTVTTPHDLSRCLFDGLRKVSRSLYGEEDLQRLLLATDYLRYSTTQGTNALVERKGPRLGLITAGTLEGSALATLDSGLFESLVGGRYTHLDLGSGEAALETAVTRAVTALTSAGANRLVVAVGGAGSEAEEKRLKRILLRKFPQHLLGAVPILYAHEVVADEQDTRRAWTALFNAFLHPAMERFLYRAEAQLRQYRTRNPLLIFRNDGQAARVAKTIAVKTYSSGPRGGAEGARALAAHYGFARLLSMDIGGTTTDIGLVENGEVRTERRGRIEGVPSSFPLCDVTSVGVGGSSILRVVEGRIEVGPDSVGGAPGPACFGFGGREATITDVFLLKGLLDPASYFGGEMRIDVERARAAVQERLATPLGLGLEAAVAAAESAWVEKVARSLRSATAGHPETVLAAFGGAGPFLACRIAEAAGLSRVIIPGLAAVFSAFGIGFSDIGHVYDQRLPSADAASLEAVRQQLLEQARRGLFAEGASLEQCQLQFTLQVTVGDQESSRPLAADAGLPADLPKGAALSLHLEAIKPISHARLEGRFGVATQPAQAQGSRQVAGQALPLYRMEQQPAGAQASGPAVLEEAFFTCELQAGWRFELNSAGDLLLTAVSSS